MPTKDLITHFLEEFRSLAQHKRIMCMVAGPNGAGKTTLWKEHLQPHLGGIFGENYINADEMQKEFPPELRDSDEGTKQAQTLASELRSNHLDAAFRDNFIYETVFSDPVGAKLRELQEGRVRGYVTVLIFVGLDDVDLAQRRVSKRVIRGGHNVKLATQISRFGRVLKNAALALDVVDLAIFLDNSRDNTPDALHGRYRALSLYQNGQLLGKAETSAPWHDEVQALRDVGRN